MTAKEYLNRARGIEQEIRQLQRMKRSAYERATGASAAPDKLPGGGGKGNDVFTAYVQYAALLDERAVELLDVQREIEQVICRLPSRIDRTVLRGYYLEGLTWEQVAVDVGKSVRQVLRIHGRALEEVHKINDIECRV